MRVSHNLILSADSFGAYILTTPKSPPRKPPSMNQCVRFSITTLVCVTSFVHLGARRVASPPLPAHVPSKAYA
jgi:hypothetical protein